MEEIVVTGSLDHALMILRRKVNASGLAKEIRVRSIPKHSSRKKYKMRLAERRRQKNEARRERWRAY
jgi:ribosomal protein S21